MMVPSQKSLVTRYKGHILQGNERSGNSIGPLSRPWKGGGPSIPYPFNYFEKEISNIPKTNMANIPKVQKAFCPHIPKIQVSRILYKIIPYPLLFWSVVYLLGGEQLLIEASLISDQQS